MSPYRYCHEHQRRNITAGSDHELTGADKRSATPPRERKTTSERIIGHYYNALRAMMNDVQSRKHKFPPAPWTLLAIDASAFQMLPRGQI